MIAAARVADRHERHLGVDTGLGRHLFGIFCLGVVIVGVYCAFF